MHVKTLEGWSSPLVRSVQRLTSEGAGTTLMQPDGSWDFAIFTRLGKTSVLRTGMTTRAVTHAHEEGDEILVVSFQPHAFMAAMPGLSLRNAAVRLPDAGKGRVRLGAELLEVPTIHNVDAFVGHLARSGVVESNSLVAAMLSGRPRSASERTLQRHFLKTTGLTHKAYTQIERAQEAVVLLRAAHPAADVAYALGYADQPHMIRSLKAIMGQTPRQVAQGSVVGKLQSRPDPAG